MRTIVKRLVLVAAGLAVGFLVAEIGMRLWLRASGTPYRMWVAAEELRRAAEPTSSFVPDGPELPTEGKGNVGRFLHPFYASEARPDSGGVLARFRKEDSEGRYRVLVLGGSVAALWGGSVAQDLALKVGRSGIVGEREVEILNFGHAAYKQPQQVNRLVYVLALGYRPDAVINIDGFNEVCAGITNAMTGTNPVYPSFPIWGGVLTTLKPLEGDQLELVVRLWVLREEARATAGRMMRWRLHASCLLGTAGLRRIHGINTRSAAIQTELQDTRAVGGKKGAVARMYTGPPFERTLENVVEACVTNWARSSEMIRAICADREIAYLHVLQPALFYGDKPRAPKEQEIAPGSKGWKLGPEVGYDRLREAGRGLAARGVNYLDLTEVFLDTDEEIFTDACHLNVRGNQILEERITAAFLEVLRR